MLPTVVLFSSASIDPVDFQQFLTQLGGHVEPNVPDHGYWDRGEETLLTSLHRDWREEYGDDTLTMEAYEDEIPTIVSVRYVMGSAPQACVVVDFTRSMASGIFAVEFAHAVNQRWPVVAIDDAGILYNSTMIACLYEEGRGFNLTTTGEPLV